MLSVERRLFGPNFVFGTATSAYQVEGGQTDGRGPSIWDSFAATPGNVKNAATGAVACDHYHRWAEDLDLVRDGGFGAYRFSFAWPRLIPDGSGAVNPLGLDFYDRLIDGMLERGIQPFATLYHWDLPSPLMDRGGWMNRDIASVFADYAALVAHHFGDRLASIATINEPWCVAFLSHYLGIHAPGYRDIRAAARAMHHVLLAHGSAVGALRAEGAMNVGVVTNLQKIDPASDADEDVAAARLFDGVFNRWYLDGIYKGKYPDDVVALFAPHLPENFEADMAVVSAPLDWAGINYYTRSLVRATPANPANPDAVPGPGRKSDLGWEFHPQGLTELLVRVSRDYTKVPLYVTENGISEDDDAARIDYYDQHLQAVLDARAQGADVRGYFAWSLLDNYEWAEGYTSRFGLVHVDGQTQARVPKGSYRAFQGMLHNAR
jgi:beta-glucosidase